LDETAASYQALQQEHEATLDELAWYKRWAFGRRRERFAELEGQGHLFELAPPVADTSEEPAPQQEAETEVKGHRRRKKREIDWEKLRKVVHDHDLDDEEKVCSCCGQPMDCIGEDVTRELEFEPARLEAHIHVRPKYARRRCKDGVSAAPLPPRPIPGGIAGPGLIAGVYIGKFGDHLPDNRHAVCGRFGGAVFVRDTLTDELVAVATAHKYPVAGLAVTPDGSTILAGHAAYSNTRSPNPETLKEDFAIRVWRLPKSVWSKPKPEASAEPTDKAKPEADHPAPETKEAEPKASAEPTDKAKPKAGQTATEAKVEPKP